MTAAINDMQDHLVKHNMCYLNLETMANIMQWRVQRFAIKAASLTDNDCRILGCFLTTRWTAGMFHELNGPISPEAARRHFRAVGINCRLSYICLILTRKHRRRRNTVGPANTRTSEDHCGKQFYWPTKDDFTYQDSIDRQKTISPIKILLTDKRRFHLSSADVCVTHMGERFAELSFSWGQRLR